jgi:hypothetical protein
VSIRLSQHAAKEDNTVWMEDMPTGSTGFIVKSLHDIYLSAIVMCVRGKSGTEVVVLYGPGCGRTFSDVKIGFAKQYSVRLCDFEMKEVINDG